VENAIRHFSYVEPWVQSHQWPPILLKMEPLVGIEPTTYSLPRSRYTAKPQWRPSWGRFINGLLLKTCEPLVGTRRTFEEGSRARKMPSGIFRTLNPRPTPYQGLGKTRGFPDHHPCLDDELAIPLSHSSDRFGTGLSMVFCLKVTSHSWGVVLDL
jgi:hypothetical protein